MSGVNPASLDRLLGGCRGGSHPRDEWEGLPDGYAPTDDKELAGDAAGPAQIPRSQPPQLARRPGRQIQLQQLGAQRQWNLAID